MLLSLIKKSLFSALVLALLFPLAGHAESIQGSHVQDERFFAASFYSEEACLERTVSVMGYESHSGLLGNRQQTSSATVSVYLYDPCAQEVVLSTSGYAEIPDADFQVTDHLETTTLNTEFLVFIPLGTGYYTPVTINLAFAGTGKLVVNTSRTWDPLSSSLAVTRSASRSGLTQGTVVLEGDNLTSNASEQSSLDLLRVAQFTRN